ncbi:SIR2 family protein [Paenibacillus naphthalenovorans]|uniref:SIR2 family protein n=1 Tax=Paenibacillus naphthalenovorans TaxID=162209 RepID=UPI000889EF50|nr:SIR2 family protein [Paenibacillus naphthalenovorans]SDJ87438.1 SIR2-like domain-containing protein [Paenibacillus naphthalenovorans]
MSGLTELVYSLREGRVIPFIGAGFSKACGFPSWYELIQKLLERFDEESFEAIDNIDLLRVAEYLKIINGNEIGPIRSEIEKVCNAYSVDISRSDPHLHLVSLGSPIIYTTNYDNLIEEAYKYTGQPYSQVVTTRDIVKNISKESTQIVKFHGSFEHEKTMVLTESDYFSRLEFETPIDIKLRSDIIGRTILFMGYSFSDFNVRYLWFKLRNMMKTMNDMDKPKSFILLANNDKISSTLFQNIGIVPIHLSEFEGNDTTERLTDFMERLVYSVHSSPNKTIKSPIIATDNQVEKYLNALYSRDEQTINAYTRLLLSSKICENQINSFLNDDFSIHGQSLGLWFDVIVDIQGESKENILLLLYKLEKELNMSFFYDIFVLAFLRYPEAREVEISQNWTTIQKLIDGHRLEPITEFQMLLDALTWARFSDDLKKDTTLYFIIFIYHYFNGRLDEIIQDPCNYDDPETSELPQEYFNITPLYVIEYIKSRATWLPEVEVIIEMMGDIGRLLEAFGGHYHQHSDFNWGYAAIDKETAEKILMIS